MDVWFGIDYDNNIVYCNKSVIVIVGFHGNGGDRFWQVVHLS